MLQQDGGTRKSQRMISLVVETFPEFSQEKVSFLRGHNMKPNKATQILSGFIILQHYTVNLPKPILIKWIHEWDNNRFSSIKESTGNIFVHLNDSPNVDKLKLRILQKKSSIVCKKLKQQTFLICDL